MPALLDRLGPSIGAIGIRMLVVDLEETRLEDRRILRAGRGFAGWPHLGRGHTARRDLPFRAYRR